MVLMSSKVFPDYLEGKMTDKQIYECTTNDGVVVYISYGEKRTSTAGLVCKNYDLETDENIISELAFNMPLETSATQRAATDLYNAMCAIVEMTTIRYEDAPHALVGEIQTLVRKGEVVTLTRAPRTVTQPSLPDSVFDKSYNLPPEIIKGTPYTPTPTQKVQALRLWLQNGKNIAVFGDTGTGKTALMRSVVAGLGVETNVLLVNAESISYLRQAPSLLTEAGGTNRLLVWLDEGQHGLEGAPYDTLLQLMEGNEKHENVVFALSLNMSLKEAQEKYGPLFRAGRTDITVELRHLTTPQAAELSVQIQRHFPDLSKDASKLSKVTATGKVSLADVWGCFSQKSVLDNVLKLYSRG